MQRSPATQAAHVLEGRRDSRVVFYAVVAFGAIGAALVTGIVELVAFAAPFVIAFSLGVSRVGPLRVRAELRLDTDQVLEGDIVAGSVVVEWDGGGRSVLDAEVIVSGLTGVAPEQPVGELTWAVSGAAGGVELPFELRAKHWGRHPAGEVTIRVRRPFGFVTWSGVVAVGPTLRVLPGTERLTRLLDPAESRAVAGMHRSRRIGHGDEFAELRPYTPGDRLRDLNWGATARHRRPYVNRHHPELAGEVVIVIDAFHDRSEGSTEALARAARAAWALASVHLQGNDRVGLVGLGRQLQWLHPAGGRRAKYELLETLLSIGAAAAGSPTAPDEPRPRVAIPASALVVALTPLYAEWVVGHLHGWRAHGRAVAAVAVDTSDLLDPPQSHADVLARRLWALDLDARKRALSDVGIPVVTVREDGPIAPVVSALRKARLAPTLRMGR